MCAHFPRLGLLVTLLALTCQLALGASVPRTADRLARFRIICHIDDRAGGPDNAPAGPLHRAPNCQVCPLCVAFTAPAPTLLSGPSLPTRTIVRLVRAAPLSRAAVPPAPGLLWARPRGPPAQA